jgi:hypothetical protein
MCSTCRVRSLTILPVRRTGGSAAPRYSPRSTSSVETTWTIPSGWPWALVDDEHELVQKAVGGVLREAGKRDRPRLIAFLDKHAATMPRVALRYAIERLDSEQRAHYLALRKAEQHE